MSERIKPIQEATGAEAKAEGQKLEWGPELDQMSWDDVQKKIAELNAGLNMGEKSWRLPTANELVNIFDKRVTKSAGNIFWAENGESVDTSDLRVDRYSNDMGLNHFVCLVRDVA